MPKNHIYKLANTITFHRNNLRNLNVVGIILLFVVIALLCYTIYQILGIKEPTYFATTSDGRLIELQKMQE